jgi:hypothetical protein
MASTGYDIDVIVNNTTGQSHWGWSQSTRELDFSMDGNVKGDGNSSSYKIIKGFAGIGMRDNTYARNGRLIESNSLLLSSRINWIYIDEAVTNNAELYSVKINESLPTLLLEKRDIRYRGDGISTRSSYVNNEYKIYTNYYANRFSKSTAVLSRYLDAKIYSDVTPASISELIGRNFSTDFIISSESDKYSELSFKSDDENIGESYLGSFTINNKISKSNKYNIEEHEDEERLGCCFLGIDAPEYNNLSNQIPVAF